MTPKQAAAIARLSSFVESYAAMGGDRHPEYVYSIHAGPDGGRSERIRISDLRALLTMVTPTPTETPPMKPDIPLSPEAARIVAAFDAVMDRAGVFEGSNDALAAALRELVEVMGQTTRGGGMILSRHDILAIAANIEQAVTYAPTETPTNAH